MSNLKRLRTLKLVTGLLTLLMGVGITTGAWAVTYERTLTLGTGAGQFNVGSLAANDVLVLHLVNPGCTPMVFRASEALGGVREWVVPANSQTTLTYNNTSPYREDVQFMVLNPMGTVISQGILIPGGVEVIPVVYPEPTRPGYIRGYW